MFAENMTQEDIDNLMQEEAGEYFITHPEGLPPAKKPKRAINLYNQSRGNPLLEFIFERNKQNNFDLGYGGDLYYSQYDPNKNPEEISNYEDFLYNNGYQSNYGLTRVPDPNYDYYDEGPGGYTNPEEELMRAYYDTLDEIEDEFGPDFDPDDPRAASYWNTYNKARKGYDILRKRAGKPEPSGTAAEYYRK